MYKCMFIIYINYIENGILNRLFFYLFSCTCSSLQVSFYSVEKHPETISCRFFKIYESYTTHQKILE